MFVLLLTRLLRDWETRRESRLIKQRGVGLVKRAVGVISQHCCGAGWTVGWYQTIQFKMLLNILLLMYYLDHAAANANGSVEPFYSLHDMYTLWTSVTSPRSDIQFIHFNLWLITRAAWQTFLEPSILDIGWVGEIKRGLEGDSWVYFSRCGGPQSRVYAFNTDQAQPPAANYPCRPAV